MTTVARYGIYEFPLDQWVGFPVRRFLLDFTGMGRTPSPFLHVYLRASSRRLVVHPDRFVGDPVGHDHIVREDDHFDLSTPRLYTVSEPMLGTAITRDANTPVCRTWLTNLPLRFP